MTALAPADRPLRILHLAFEDHRRPGSGGGALRTREINTRLGRQHHVTAVVARYRGARRRVEDGVDYRPLGLALGHRVSIMSYHLALPWFVMRHRADIVVEDFAAPHSSDLIPLWTASPTVAVVQWLFADGKSKQYRLPFWVLEGVGVRIHRRFVAVSQYIADCLQCNNPQASVEVVYAGVNPPPAPTPALPRCHLLFLGRLETDGKGLDLLVDAFDGIQRRNPDIRLRVAGDGAGRGPLEQLLTDRGLHDKVDWLGRLDDDAKWAALRQAAIVLMPSRFETFGLVALEAMSVGTPVVAFALPSLREIVAGTGGAILVPTCDAAAMGRAASELLDDPARQEHMSEAGRKRAATFDWDEAACAHERIYRDAIAAHCADNRRPAARLRLLLGALRQLRQTRGTQPDQPRPAITTVPPDVAQLQPVGGPADLEGAA